MTPLDTYPKIVINLGEFHICTPVLYNDTFKPFFVERYVISERADTSFPNVLIRHFRTCKYVISERADT